MVPVIFVPKHLVMFLAVYQTTTGDRASNHYNKSNTQKNLLSNVEVVTLLKFCTNFQVFAHFALQSSPTKLYILYLSCKHFPEITQQYLLFAPLFLHLKHFEASALLCVVNGTMGAIRWTRPPHFFRQWGYNMPCSPHFSL